MIIPINDLNKTWENACTLYKEKSLPGIAYLTVKVDEKTRSTGVVIFVTRHSDNECDTRKCGEMLAEKMNYVSPDGKMQYRRFLKDNRCSKSSFTIEVR